MSDKKRKVPKLRFPGFTDSWEQRKLIDYLEVSKEKNKDGTFDKEDVLSVSGFYGIVNQIEFQGRSFAGSSVANYGVVKNGDVVYTKSPLKSNPYGIIKTNKGNPGVVSTLYAVYRPLKNTHSDFIQTYFEQDARMNNYMSPLVNKGAKNDMKVSDENALKGEVIFPSKEEQVKISDYFEMLNKLLSLHQRKLDNVKMLKKSLLQKLFPKDGEKTPELRFPGFTDAWEQRKLGDIASMHARIGWQNLRTSEFLDSGEYMLITGTDFSNGGIDYSGVHYVEKDRYDQDSKIQLDSESILITKDGTIGKVAYVSDLPMPATLNAGVFNVRVKDRNHFDSYYLFQYLKAPFLLDYVRKTSTGGTILHLNQNVLVNFPIYYGSKSEQKAVGDYLKNLDSLISLHQRKLDHLKELKKGLLQQMFV